MNLSKRASFLILPVILVSYALAALLVYQQESESLKRLEQNQIDHRMGELQSTFNTYRGFVDAYQLSLVEGDVLASYFRDPLNIYRGKILTANLENSVKRYLGSKNEFASLSIIDRKNDLAFYIENSTDPFATATPEQFALSEIMRTQKLLVHWQHLQKEKFSIIQQGFAIDSRTFAPPLITDMNHSIQIIVAIKPHKFDQQLQLIEQEYDATSQFVKDRQDSIPTNDSLIYGSTKLKSGYYLQVTPAPDYLTAKLTLIKQRLFLIFAISTIVTFALLQFLIRHFITNPITALDQQLTAVTESKQKKISYQNKNDEVSRLGSKFSKLHAELSSSLVETKLQSRTDALTQLPNRASFYEYATKLMAQAASEDESLAIIYLDLDNFKFVNDKHGHEVGDKLLKSAASHLNHTVSFLTQKTDHAYPQVFRLSGDEFIILVQDKNQDLVQKLGQKILNLFSHGYRFELGNFPVTASLGIAYYPKDGHTLSQLISNADLAMYQAKKTGKNKQSFYSQELAKKDRKLREIESRLKAIDFDAEFTLNYMPIIGRNGSTKGCEALLRWNSPELGQVSPDLFIPIAETSGLFEKIDLWVIQKVFQDLPSLRSLFGDTVEISINISSAELNSGPFADKLAELQQLHHIQTKNITLEITETFAADQEKSALDWLQKLQEPGYKIAIDDFGTGFTSLMQMVDYPVDIIKFDRQLVERIAKPHKQALAKSLIDLCHLQGLEVVAEGVETQEQYDLLMDVHCDYQQGYLIAKPMPFEELSDWVRENSRNPRSDSAS